MDSIKEILEEYRAKKALFKKEHPVKYYTKEFIKEIAYKYLNITRFFRSLTISCNNFIKWFYIIKDDRSWDFVYIYIILQHKLKDIRDYIKVQQTFEGYEKVVEDMTICIEILERLINDDYSNSDEYKALYKQDIRLALDYEYEVKKNDRKLLFQMLEEHIEEWWD